VTLLVDTSVWSLAFRRDRPSGAPEVRALAGALAGNETVATTGIVLLELLRGVVPPKVRAQILDRFEALELISPDLADYAAAAELGNVCRAAGVQVGTIDALLASIAITYELTLLTTDIDFRHIAGVAPLRIWTET